MKKMIYLMISFCITISLCSCSKKELFIDHSKDYVLKPMADTELKDDVYYVKDGSLFYEVYMPKGNKGNMALNAKPDTLFWVDEDYSLIPTYYKNEMIAYQSKSTTLKGIKIIRFNPIGYSLGLYDAKYDEDGYITFSVSKNTIAGSSLNQALQDAVSDDIRLATINDIPVTEAMLTEGGVLNGLEKNKSYTLGLYTGTHYGTVNVIADRFYFEGYEEYNIDKATPTKNGYLSVQMPEDAKSGYYMINGTGLYIYKAQDKMEQIAEEDMGIPYYTSEEEKYAANYLQYVAPIQNYSANVKFDISYDENSCKEEELSFIALSPDGVAYEIIPYNGMATLEIKQVMAGRWTINIAPRTVEVKDIVVIADNLGKDSTLEEKTYEITEPEYDVVFTVEYEGDGEVWGVIMREDGESIALTNDTTKNFLTAEYAFMEAGIYTVKVYHYPDTAITSIKKEEKDTGYEEEIITLEE